MENQRPKLAPGAVVGAIVGWLAGYATIHMRCNAMGNEGLGGALAEVACMSMAPTAPDTILFTALGLLGGLVVQAARRSHWVSTKQRNLAIGIAGGIGWIVFGPPIWSVIPTADPTTPSAADCSAAYRPASCRDAEPKSNARRASWYSEDFEGLGPGKQIMVLGPGRYRAEVSVSRNLDCSYGRCRSTNAIFFPETMSGTPMVSWMNEIAESYSDFEVFTLRRQEEVWVRIDTAPRASWSIRIRQVR